MWGVGHGSKNTRGGSKVPTSRVTSREGLKVLALGEDEKPTVENRNIVYHEVFASVQAVFIPDDYFANTLLDLSVSDTSFNDF